MEVERRAASEGESSLVEKLCSLPNHRKLTIDEAMRE